ncbi:hypothetical protein BsWGS_19311 [Bradybaena similaris]
MPMIRRKKSVSNTQDVFKSSSIKHQLREPENKQNATDREQVNSGTVSKTFKDDVETRKREAIISSFSICRNSRSTQVVEVHSGLADVVTAEHVSKTTDGNVKDDLQNKALPLPAYSVDNENIKPPLIKGRSREEMAPPRRSVTSETSFVHQNAVVENMTSKLGNKRMPKQKQIRKKSFKTEEDIQLVYKDQIAHLGTAVPETSSKIVPTSGSHPTVEEESDLLENAEQERRRNKDRTRANNLIKNKCLSPTEVINKMDIAYLNAQREMDQILESQSLKLKRDLYLHRDTARREKNNIDINGEDNEAYKSDENYSLEKARQKMHKLLDDAFDVISQKKTNVIEKVQPSKEMRNSADSCNNREGNHPKSMEKIVQTEESMLSYKLHTPMQVHHSFVFNDPKGLIAWNPYRAYDDTTQISLNNPEANMNTEQVMQENMGTSIFVQPFMPKCKYYATGPGEPIIIKTINVEEDIIQNNAHKIMSIPKHSQQSGINENLPSYIKSRNVFHRLMPVKSEDIYPNKFYDLGCFQETPRTSQLIQMETLDSTQPPSPSEDARRTASSHALYTKEHKEPSKSIDQNNDIVDVIKESLQPGISPQPLIDSLRKELQILSSKAHTPTKQANEDTTINNSINLRNQ